MARDRDWDLVAHNLGAGVTRFFDPFATMMEDHRRLSETVLLGRLRPRYWFARALIYMQVFISIVLVSWFDSNSLTWRAISSTGGFGWCLMFLTAFFCLMGVVDVVVNDLMPDRFRLPTAYRWRHWSLLGISLSLGMLGLLVAVIVGWTWLLPVYWFNSMVAGFMTFMDAFARYPRSVV